MKATKTSGWVLVGAGIFLNTSAAAHNVQELDQDPLHPNLVPGVFLTSSGDNINLHDPNVATSDHTRFRPSSFKITVAVPSDDT